MAPGNGVELVEGEAEPVSGEDRCRAVFRKRWEVRYRSCSMAGAGVCCIQNDLECLQDGLDHPFQGILTTVSDARGRLRMG